MYCHWVLRYVGPYHICKAQQSANDDKKGVLKCQKCQVSYPVLVAKDRGQHLKFKPGFCLLLDPSFYFSIIHVLRGCATSFIYFGRWQIFWSAKLQFCLYVYVYAYTLIYHIICVSMYLHSTSQNKCACQNSLSSLVLIPVIAMIKLYNLWIYNMQNSRVGHRVLSNLCSLWS